MEQLHFGWIGCVAWLQQKLEDNGWMEYERLEHTGRSDGVSLFLWYRSVIVDGKFDPVGGREDVVGLKSHGFHLNRSPYYIFLGASDEFGVLIWRRGFGSGDQQAYHAYGERSGEAREPFAPEVESFAAK